MQEKGEDKRLERNAQEKEKRREKKRNKLLDKTIFIKAKGSKPVKQTKDYAV